MQQALGSLADGQTPSALLTFPELREVVGFDDYDAEAARYAARGASEESD
jgi:hypothetical protein